MRPGARQVRAASFRRVRAGSESPMSDRGWPEHEKEGEERTPPEPDEEPETGRTAGGVDPLTGEQGETQSSNADIPAA